MASVKRCKKCGCELPADFKPIRVRELRLVICSECMIDLAAHNTPVVNLWQYSGVAEPEPTCSSQAFRGLEWGFVFTLGMIAIALVVRYIGGIL